MSDFEKALPSHAIMRSSNIELLRIVAMLVIIAHHFVVNSTVMSLFDAVHPTCNSVFLQLWGMWGKAAINIFVLITGYFMCQGQLTVRRYLKVLLEIVFYSWFTWFALAVCGYDRLSCVGAIKRLFCYSILVGPNRGFVPAFMWMYLLIPALNAYLKGASRRNLYATLAVLLAMFSLCGTMFNANVYHHVFWYVTLYLTGALIRKCPFEWMMRNKICVPLLVLSVAMAWCSVIGIDLLSWVWCRPIVHPYYFVEDSHKVIAFVTSVFSFLVFKNWQLPQSRFVNVVASTTFGILLIHAASDGMRRFLWQDVVNVPSAYSLSLPILIGYSVFVVVAVFVVCSAIDYLRIIFVERPIFSRFS